MPGKPPGPIVLGIMAVLADGPKTRSEICAALGRSKTEVGSVVSRMSKPRKTVPKRIFIESWAYDDDTSSLYYPRAVYALGDKTDAPKPRQLTNAERMKRYRSHERYRVNSVFMWAAPRRARAAMRRGEV